MKIHSLAALFSATVLAVSAQEAPFQTPALLIEEGGQFQQVYLMASTKSAFRYRESEVSTDTKDAKLRSYDSIFILEPKEYSAAMELFQARKYEEAKAKFVEVKERFKPIATLENNPSTMAAFYELECLRKLGDLDGLAGGLQTFIKDPLSRETQLRQLELYILWDAVRTQSWDRLEILVRERENTRLPGDQRAQVGYCLGQALEGLQRPKEAIFAYDLAMTADAGASEVVARKAALRVLAIHSADPAVQAAIKLWGTKDENKNSAGYADLIEAAGVAELFEMSLGAGKPLPQEFKDLLKYKPEANPDVKPASKNEAEPEAKPEPAPAGK